MGAKNEKMFFRAGPGLLLQAPALVTVKALSTFQQSSPSPQRVPRLGTGDGTGVARGEWDFCEGNI